VSGYVSFEARRTGQRRRVSAVDSVLWKIQGKQWMKFWLKSPSLFAAGDCQITVAQAQPAGYHPRTPEVGRGLVRTDWRL